MHSFPIAKGSIEIPASHRLLEGTYKTAQSYKLETKLARSSTNAPKSNPNVSLNNQVSTVEPTIKKPPLTGNPPDISPQTKWPAEVREVAQHNAKFKTQATTNSNKIPVEYMKGKIPHVLRDAEGHLPYTPANEELLINVSSDASNYFAKPDKYGSQWCEKFLDDGTQLWVQLRNGLIRNGGKNLTPIKWDPATGLSQNLSK